MGYKSFSGVFSFYRTAIEFTQLLRSCCLPSWHFGLLPKKGNPGTAGRMGIVELCIGPFGREAMDCLVAGWEFVVGSWLACLNAMHICWWCRPGPSFGALWGGWGAGFPVLSGRREGEGSRGGGERWRGGTQGGWRR